jgi:hypothetical protein
VRDVGHEWWDGCPRCKSGGPVTHDHTRYGPAFLSYSAILLRLAGAGDYEVELICRALSAR